jgi:hypothetical protein
VKVSKGESSLFVRLKVMIAGLLPFPVWALLYPFNQCAKYVTGSDGNVMGGRIGCFENLEADFRECVEDIGMDSSDLDLPKLNQTKHGEYGAYIGNSLIKRALAAKVKSDMEAFYRAEQRPEKS